MSADTSSLGNPDDRLAARATLLALRAMLLHPGEVRLRLFFILPSLAPRTEELALDALVALPKPVACFAFAAGGAMALAHYPLATVLPIDRELDEETAGYERQYGPDARVELRGYRDSLLLTLPQLRHWREQYELPFGSRIGDAADERAHAAGAQALLRFGPPADPRA
ncbi:MAG TPA: hypothetical protein VF041_06025 [Gemmatimonadaceae bacterium]